MSWKRSCLVIVSVSALIVVGCSNADNAGPPDQGQINNVAKTLQKTQGSTPDVPLELRNKGISAGPKKGG